VGLALSFREQLTRFYHKESSSPHPAIVPIEGAVLFELDSPTIFTLIGGHVFHQLYDYLPNMDKAVLSISVMFTNNKKWRTTS
jgi:hypothetical protein